MMTTRATTAMMFALVGCATVPRSTTGRLGYEQSMAEVKLPVRDTAREVTRLFTTRGYALTRQTPMGEGVALSFKGHRDAVYRYGVQGYGSEFAVSVSAAGEHAVIAVEGMPTLNNQPVCRLGARLPCTGFASQFEIDGEVEAEVVQGVIAELTLEDLVVPLDGAHPAVQAARAEDRARCKEQARRAIEEARLIDDPARRLRVVEAIEPCN